MPTIRRLLVDSAAEAGLLVAVSDAAGRLLWVEGSSGLRSRAEPIAFVAGANWSESRVGTNAPGTALTLDRAVQIFGAEHLSRPVTPWSCSAAPIHDPASGAIMGVLDLTGGPQVAAPQSLSLIRATVAAVEAELRLDDAGQTGEPRTSSSAPVRQVRSTLQVLGTRGALLGHGSATRRLSLRHSEMLYLLATAPQGLTASELAIGLGSQEQASVTVRAELSRLRALIKPVHMHSRPYLLSNRLDIDATRVVDALRHGQLRRAVAAYHGPLLARSGAPAIVKARSELHDELRTTLLDRLDPDALLTFGDTEHGRDDLEIWEAAWRVLPAGSPRSAHVQAHVQRLRAAAR